MELDASSLLRLQHEHVYCLSLIDNENVSTCILDAKLLILILSYTFSRYVE